ncbi:MAG: hypothetical protein EYC70_10515 [Planctomycetota bacterium]|nr:MAG: hypothetical protein EYC70_10515 [Planctomycetota bacterium]
MRRLAFPALLIGACAAPQAQEAPAPDPTQAEVPLPALSGWRGALVIDNGKTGIWTVKSFDFFPRYGCPEVIGLDDKGVCHVLYSYSGKWTPIPMVHDGQWLGGLDHGDVDPRIPGAELYTGGLGGTLWQLVPHLTRHVDARLIGLTPGAEIHTIVAAGSELYLFTAPGALWLSTPTGPDGRFETRKLEELPGRVRDAVLLPARSGTPPRIATASRAGRLELLELAPEGRRWTTLHQESMGMGRLALRRGPPLVLYSTLDDGRLMRHEEGPDGSWRAETIYLGPQGHRGVAAGRFDADPNVETVAVFGYSHKVELLTRTAHGWKAETIFEDRDKGHWLSTAELDGRNSTDELLASGYGGRIVLLARPPGSGRTELAVAP